MRRSLFCAPTLALAVAVAHGLVAPPARSVSVLQYQGQKGQFVEALFRFTTATAGTYGDEGGEVWSSIESMERALVRWDQAVRAYETNVRSQASGVDGHVALAAVYLDRGRIESALREFAEAIRLDSVRPELYAFQGLAYGLDARPAEAAEALRKAAALDPDEPTTTYVLSQHLSNLGRQEEAASALHRFEVAQRKRVAAPGRQESATAPFMAVALVQEGSLAPIFPLAHYAQGFALVKQGDYERAMAEFREAAASDPLSAGAIGPRDGTDRIVQGSAALRRGALGPALDHLAAAVEERPARAEARRLLGMAYWADEQYGRSIEELTAAVGLSPRDERARLALADVFVAAGQPAEAERTLVETVQLIPRSGQARYRLGRLYHEQERYQEAVREFEEALAAGPLIGFDHLYQLIGLTRALARNAEGVIEAYRRRIDINPNNAEAHRELGEVYIERDRYDEALAEFLATLLINPRDSDAHAAIAKIHLESRRYVDAADAARRALQASGSHKEAQYVLATALIRLGRTEEGAAALEEFERMQAEALTRERREYDLDALKRRAFLSLERGEYDTAVALLRQAIAYEPNQPGLHVSLGLALSREGRHEEAIESYNAALALDAGADVHRRVAEAYRAIGRLDESRRHETLYQQQKEDRLRRGMFR